MFAVVAHSGQPFRANVEEIRPSTSTHSTRLLVAQETISTSTNATYHLTNLPTMSHYKRKAAADAREEAGDLKRRKINDSPKSHYNKMSDAE